MTALPESKKSLSVSSRTSSPRRVTVVETLSPRPASRTAASMRRLSASKSSCSCAASCAAASAADWASASLSSVGHGRLDGLHGRDRGQRRVGRGAVATRTRRRACIIALPAVEHGAGERLLQRLLEHLDLRHVRRRDREEDDEHREEQRHHVVAGDEPALVVLVLLLVVLLMPRVAALIGHLRPPASARRPWRPPAAPRVGRSPGGT